MTLRILMVAAENGALRGGKVGGVGDVLRDVPRALTRLGHELTVITPAYGRLAQDNPAQPMPSVTTTFCGEKQTLEMWHCQPYGTGSEQTGQAQAVYYLLDHPDFAPCGAGNIYCHDSGAPFATDAHKFALFCAGVADWLLAMPAAERPDVIHLHDWHTAPLLLLRHTVARFQALQSIHSVFTVHNLALQGIRPWQGDASSPLNWFPQLQSPWENLSDPRYPWCINLLRCGLQLSDRVHVVSPGYSHEILLPSQPARGFHGGEGLEHDLQQLTADGRLHGILNGCEYPPAKRQVQLSTSKGLRQLCAQMRETLLQWATNGSQVPAAHVFALDRVQQWAGRKQGFSASMVFIGRLTAQKVALLMYAMHDGRPALAHLLEALGEGVLVFTGTGEAHYQDALCDLMRKHENFLFLQGFSESLADTLYGAADLFVMPSSFEPCGISQMLAMRAGTPCIVHHVGGLRDTVVAGENGFAFTGDNEHTQVRNMLQSVNDALAMVAGNTQDWRQLRKQAAAARFEWQGVAQDYVDVLYQPLKNTASY